MKAHRPGGKPRSRLRRWLKPGAALALLAAVALFLARTRLVGAAVGSVLRRAGASDVRLSVAQASPWRVVLADVAFNVRTQPFAAKRVTFQRAHWWAPSLGAVRVEQARLPLTVDGSDTNPWSWATYRGGSARLRAAALPADSVSIDGTLVVRAAAVPEQELTVKLEAALDEAGHWQGTVQADGPGLHLAAEGLYRHAAAEMDFAVPQLRVELKAWQEFVRRMVFLPGGKWELEGTAVAEAAGRLRDGKVASAGTVSLREGRLANRERKISATGVEFDLEFEEFETMRSKPGALRIAGLGAGGLQLTGIEAGFAFENDNFIKVSRAAGGLLGGRMATEPFNVFLDQQDLECVLLADGLDVERILALIPDVPAKATGRVDGRLPIRVDEQGLRLGTGWLEMKKGAYAEIQFNAAGLLTRGVDTKSVSYPVLQKLEAGLLRLKLGAMRIDLYPPDRPPGLSARLHLAGEPTDPTVKAPVTLDLNVNGPLEKLLNLGLDSRVRIGPGK